MLRTGLGLAAAAACAGAVHAAPELGEKVYAPYIEDGETSVELRGGRSIGGPADGGDGATVELERGFNDRVSGALLLEFERVPGRSERVDSIGAEAVVATGRIPVVDIDTGVYVEFDSRLYAESAIGEFKALLAKRAGPFQARLNLIVGQPFSARDDRSAFNYAASADWAVTPDLRLGAEAFGEFGTSERLGGRRQAYVGPLVKYVVNGIPYVGLKLEAAYLLAVGHAPSRADSQARLVVELEKRF